MGVFLTDVSNWVSVAACMHHVPHARISLLTLLPPCRDCGTETHRRDKGYNRKIAKEDAMRVATLEWSETAAARLAAELAEAEGSGTEHDKQKQGRSGGGRNDAPFDASSAAQKAAHEREARQRELLKKKLAWQCSLCGQAGNPPKCEKCMTCGRPRGYEPALCERDGGGHVAPDGIAHSKIEHERTVFDRAFLGVLASVDSTYWLEHTSARDIVTAGDRKPDNNKASNCIDRTIK